MRYVVEIGEARREVEVRPGDRPGHWAVRIGDRELSMEARSTGATTLLVGIGHAREELHVMRRGASSLTVCSRGEAVELVCRTAMEDQLARAATTSAGSAAQEAQVRANMPGKVIEVRARVGDSVTAGQCLVVLEAMKMENSIQAKGPGLVKAVHVAAGTTVDGGALLLEIDPGGQTRD